MAWSGQASNVGGGYRPVFSALPPDLGDDNGISQSAYGMVYDCGLCHSGFSGGTCSYGRLGKNIGNMAAHKI